MKTICFIIGTALLIGCTKTLDTPGNKEVIKEVDTKPGQYSNFTIQQGAHHCDENPIKAITTSEMKFMVKFDSSAIYQTVLPENQYAINKLWGFSEGIDNHFHSARIGWSWTSDALRLYGYVYVNGEFHYQEITSVMIGEEITCSIKPLENTYLFTVNSVFVSLPRGLSAAQVSGYQQYPYFGGNEVAPHLIRIQIKSL
jgi:hypothetical protein